MHFRTAAAAALLTVGAVAAATGIAHAEPTPTSEVHYAATQSGKSAVVTVDAGSLLIDQDRLQVKDQQGQLLASMPLSFH
ncbi:hypothetical protein ACFWF3_24355, partial [Nocardia sp. NPDC060220]